ncbi:MAG: calcium/sodium antiporter [Gammaproteobacteria bacterium]|nr:MAG: calcium/sodium antiporter [Pseudomonadota bacterium]PIE38206.1 MAG: calcium/sodium antiporter [Gammaproteobacteria bacterium]
MDLVLFFTAIGAGLALLVWSADQFVSSSVSIARNMGVSTIVIGLTVVAFGTSAPEMVVSATAAFEGSTGLATGNAIGSNIANIGLVLGVTALISPLPVKPLVLKRELPVLLAVSLLVLVVLYDSTLSYFDGAFLLTLMVIAMFVLTRKGEQAPELDEELENIPESNTLKAIAWFAIGLIALIGSSKLLVWGATGLAKFMGVSDLIIGLTIVAIGTSLPELAASVASALKGHHDIALGNVIGSNLFNLLTVLPLPALISPGPLEPIAVYRDYGYMLAMTLLIAGFAYIMRRKGRISRAEGGVMFAAYIAYLLLIYQTASGF